MRFFACIAVVFIIGSCRQPGVEQKINETVANRGEIGMELIIPHNSWGYDSSDLPGLFRDCADNKVFVLIKNNTDSVVRFYEQWNSWGYYNFSFKVETE